MNAPERSLAAKPAVRLISGNHACALGAVAAGCRFFAGYPITPSSEVAERLSRALPPVNGVFVQMEDELASMAAVIGASMGGVKAMTATSGPGFSLKQENIGYAAGAEIPCVIINVMRGGPSTGMPTRPAQGDLMQARWGSHGDYPIIALAPASVREIYYETMRAFDLAETFRTPVVVLYDQAIAQLTETVELAGETLLGRAERKWASGPRQAYQPYASGPNAIPAMSRPGDGYRTHTTGLNHSESGFPTQDPDAVTRNLGRLLAKFDAHRHSIDAVQTIGCEDADVVVVAIGISARAATRAVEQCRSRGLRAGLFRPITLWPFPETALREATAHARAVLVPELNAGQLRLEVERILRRQRVEGLHLISGEPISPAAIAGRIEALMKETPVPAVARERGRTSKEKKDAR
jgi:2-oxoglutarate/2-oxoacid ferredoxin oxidoreductase subunit alpha